MKSERKSICFRAIDHEDDDRVLMGFIKSGDLIDNFTPDEWKEIVGIETFQRSRIPNQKKKDGLNDVYDNKKVIDGLILYFDGDIVIDRDEVMLEGKISVLEGHQRIVAIKENGNREFVFPIQMCCNMTANERRDFYNRMLERTAHSSADKLKSAGGSIAKMLQKVCSGGEFPVPVSFNHNGQNIKADAVAKLSYLVYNRLISGTMVRGLRGGKSLIGFANETFSKDEMELVEFAVKNVLRTYVDTFGKFKLEGVTGRKISPAYNLVFLFAVCHVIVDYFLTRAGKIDYNGFAGKFRELPGILNHSVIVEFMQRHDRTAHTGIYKFVRSFLNHKKAKENKLPLTPASRDDAFGSDEEDVEQSRGNGASEPVAITRYLSARSH